MITVTYNQKKHIVKVEGHAKSGEYGHDLICASASILVHTLIANVQYFEKGSSKKSVVKLECGNAYIHCKPLEEHEGACELIFNSICVGFELLACNYPKNISYKIV